jgi:hypothetical protein
MSGSQNSRSDLIWASQNTIGSEIGVDERTVRRCLGRLIELGFVRERQRGVRLTDQYVLSWPPESEPLRERTISPDQDRTKMAARTGRKHPTISVDDLSTSSTLRAKAARGGELRKRLGSGERAVGSDANFKGSKHEANLAELKERFASEPIGDCSALIRRPV